jgi:hypothetical protein
VIKREKNPIIAKAQRFKCRFSEVHVWSPIIAKSILWSPIITNFSKLTKAQIQPRIDKIADLLASWKVDLLTRTGSKILVQFVLTSMIVYLAMALDLPPWAIKAIEKIRRGFLWKGRKDVKGGHCLLAWPKVT